MADFEQIAANGRHNGHPRMFGYVQSSGSFAGVVGDLLASALNQNVTSWRSAPAATTIEHQVIDWLKTMVGFDPDGSGILLSGGSFANFAGLAVGAARQHRRRRAISDGVAALPGKPRIYASAMTHMSIAKGCVVARHRQGRGRRSAGRCRASHGCRSRSRRQIESRSRERLSRDLRGCDRGRCQHRAPSIRSTRSRMCARRTGCGCMSMDRTARWPRSRRTSPARCRRLARADSLSLDPHKWLYAPLDAGCLLVRDQRALRRAFSESADYIDVVADRDMSDYAYWDHSPELSRRFRALKIWFLLKIHGARAIQQAIDRQHCRGEAPGAG